MAKCQLIVELEDAGRAYVAGEELSGRVRVIVDKDVRCDGLTIAIGWMTHGRGNRDRKEYQSREAFNGEWRAGQTYEYAFQFVVPKGPVTYHGETINVDWGVDAVADIPWAIDPKARADFLVTPTPPTGDRPPETAHVHDWSDATGVNSAGAALNLGIFMLVLSVLSGTLAALAFTDVIDFGPPSFFCAIVSLMMLVAGISYCAKGLRNRVAERRLGVVHFETSRTHVRRGDEVDCKVMLEPPVPVEIRGIAAKLVCTEICISGSGTNQTTSRKVVHERSWNLHQGGQFTPPAHVSGGAAVQIPSDAGLSFNANNNDVMWHLEVRVDVPRYPDWAQIVSITVGA